jgi:hypothetical protein
MTIREKFNRRMRPFSILAGVSAVLIVAGVFAGMGGPPVLALVIPGFAIFMLAGVWMQLFALRCPVCSGNCGPLVMQQSWLKVNVGLKYCPYCGVGLDDELDSTDDPDDQQF